MNNKQQDYRVLVISGKGNVGKTSSILIASTLIIDYLKSKYQDFLCDGPHRYGIKSEDCWLVLKAEGKRIGIISKGDSPRAIEQGLNYVGECDFYICASHLYGNTVNCVLNNERFDKESIIFINKVGLNGGSVDILSNDYRELKDSIDKNNKSFASQIKDLFLKVFLVDE